MAKKTVHAYELELRRMIKSRTGVDAEPWLNPQIEATAMNRAMIAKVHEELAKKDSLVVMQTGSKGQMKNDAHPLLAHYDKMQRTLTQQLEALGLNYRTTPSKVTELAHKGVDEDNPMKIVYEQAKL